MTDQADTTGKQQLEGAKPAAAHVMPRCPACGAPEQLVWVHGHGQCAHCHMNVMPCCDGEVCDPQ